MAIYQLGFSVVPKKGVVGHFGKVPSKIGADFSKRKINLLVEGDDQEIDYFEFIQEKCWGLVQIDSKEIITQIDQKLERADWGNDEQHNNWKTETDEEDNDAFIFTNEAQDEILEFSFRADLRQSKLRFLIEMVLFSKEENYF